MTRVGTDAPGTQGLSPELQSILSSRSVLVVDDEDSVRELLIRWLEISGYAVAGARGAEEALARLDAHPAAVVVCDIRMPGRDGLWLAARIRQRFPETAVVMSTGVQDVEASAESMRQGVIDYLTKPFGRDRLRDAVNRAVEWHQAAWESRRWVETLQREMDGLKARLCDFVHRAMPTSTAGVETMLSALSAGSPAMDAHARRVAALSLRTGRAAGLTDEDLTALERAALLHDIGRLAVPEAVLLKPAPLTAEERTLIRSCPRLAADILAGIPCLGAAALIVGNVHERVDGQGYPRGLRGDQVRIESRIIAVADAYDTMTHPRVYRDPISSHDALLEIARCTGTQFDPVAVAAFQTARSA